MTAHLGGDGRADSPLPRADSSRPRAQSCLSETLGRLHVKEALDVGCGSGQFTRTLARELGGFRAILGVDPDKDSLDEARRLTEHRAIRYRLLSGQEMPFYDGRFELAALANALHHVEDPSAVLGEIRRVTASRGWIIVQEPVSDGLSPAEETGKSVHHFKADIDRANGRSHRPTYRRDEVRGILAAARLEIEHECELRDRNPAVPGSEEVMEALAFLGEYVEFVRGFPDAADFEAEAARIARALQRDGIASPPRLLIRARLLPPS